MLSLNQHRNIFLLGIIGLSAGMLFGTVPTSIPQIILAANWLLEGNFFWKWKQLKFNKVFWLLVSFYLIHVIGMVYTSNFQSGLDDLRNKLPLLILPLMLFSTRPLKKKELNLILSFFIAGVVISSFSCYALTIFNKELINIRQASVFMSHIRFSLFIAFACFVSMYFAYRQKRLLAKACYISLIIWFLFFMYRMEMATGFICMLSVALILLLFYGVLFVKKPYSIMFFTSIIALIFSMFYYVNLSLLTYKPSQNNGANTLLTLTLSGKQYLQDTAFNLAENGNLIAININDYELEKEWNVKSKLLFSGNDKKNNTLRFTLLRYLASKGLTKDSAGLNHLTPTDIENIEKGIPNYKFASHTGLLSRWHELAWEYTKYRRGENPSGHTLTMRLEFWKTACYIISKYPVFGVGTGDAQVSFNEAYVSTNSKLDLVWHLRSHNQYLAIGVAFGVTGFIFFIFYLLYPAFTLKNDLHVLYWPFILIALLSFFTEDTLETQSGVTFFVFFQTLFLWMAYFKGREGVNNKPERLLNKNNYCFKNIRY